MDKNIEVLQEVLDLLESEKRKFYDMVNQNDFRIEEINSYLRELSKNEEDDFKIFSPRNAENRHRDQIEADTVEKKKCENENVEYKKKIEYLKLLSDKVNVVIQNLYIENESEKESEENLSDEKNDKGSDPNEKYTVEKCEQQNETDDDKSVVLNNLQLENAHFAHQILNCVSFIVSDAERARVELTAIAKKMQSTDV